MVQWDDITDNGTTTLVGGAIAFDTLSMFLTITICVGVILVALLTDDYLRRHAERRPRGLRALPGRGDRRHRDGVGQRPHRAVPRPRDAVARAVRAGGEQSPQQRERRRRASSTSCSAASRRRSSCTASRSSTARPAARTSPRSSPRCRTASTRSATSRWRSPASPCCSSASASRSRRCRSTCGRPTCTRARPTPVTAFMASVGKAAAFAAMLRVLVDRAAVLPRRLAAGHLGARRRHAARRVGPRRRADQREADARLLLDQPRRVHPGRRRGRRARRRRGRPGSRHAVGRAVPDRSTRCW